MEMSPWMLAIDTSDRTEAESGGCDKMLSLPNFRQGPLPNQASAVPDLQSRLSKMLATPAKSLHLDIESNSSFPTLASLASNEFC